MGRDDDDQDPEIALTEELSQSARDEALEETRPAERSGWHPPARIDEYELVKALGSGGMGRVYEYRDTNLERPVAIKFVSELSQKRAARLLDEARAAAELMHNNVAATYRAGAVDGVPFIVSQYIDGKSLEQKTPLQPWRRALAVATDLARGLAEAHRHGVVHGDIKPANAMLDAHGVARLIDFGLARRTEQAIEQATDQATDQATEPGSGDTGPDGKSRIYGTPSYMAPEIEHGGGTTKRSDVYAFGVMLYELCTGRTPQASEDALANIDAGLAAIVQRCTARDPAQRYASAKQLLEALENLDRPVTSRGKNPYRWLRPFEAEHRALFFGRNSEIWEVLERLRADHLVILAGGSGVGKSSLARAGVLPRIAEGGLGEGRAWQTCTMLPGTRPLASLCQQLAARIGVEDAELDAELRARDFVALRRRLRALHGRDSGTVLFVDQLEELVTLASTDEAAIVGEALASLVVERTPGLRILATARLDQVARLAHVPGLGRLVQGGVHIVGPLGPGAVRDTIVEPARAVGVEFESDALVDDLARIISQAEGALPLLQFTLARLWEQRDERGQAHEQASDMITRKALDELGGVEGALAQHADRVVQSLLPANRKAARALLVRMVTLDDTRARVPRDELEDGDGPRHTALEKLIDERLVVADEAEGGPVCEIAHEALISAWPQLEEWLEEEKGTRAVVTRISRAAAEWAGLGKGRDGLWGARHLRDVQEIDTGHLSGLERAFLAASRRAVARAWWLKRLAFGAPVVVAAVVYSAVWYAQARELDSKVNREVAAARSSLAEARTALDAFREGRGQAVSELGDGELIASDARERAEQAWESALAHEHKAERAYRNASTSLERAIGLDPGRGSTRELVAQVLDERAVFASERYLLDEQAELVERLEFYDASRHARWTQPIAVQVDTEPPGAEVVIEPAPAGAGTTPSGAPVRLRAPFDVALAPGSYVLIVKEDREHVEVRYPIYLRPRSSALGIEIARPAKAHPAAARGMVHVPQGRFLFGYGSGRASEMMRPFFETVPVHERQTGAFWIARHETTYAEWIEFLEACRPARCADITPVLPAANDDNLGYRIGLVRTAHGESGEWELEVQPEPEQETLRARYGHALVYTAREGAAQKQDWRKLPVTGVTQRDIQEYLDWLASPDNPRGLPGARLCREDEWERAARGADTRMYPHGDMLGPEEANIDITYGRKPGAYGPDEVGAHESSGSPFGLHDMTGNVWEMTISMFEENTPVRIRGGSYFQDQHSAAVVNRWVVSLEHKDARTGFRVCASAGTR